MKTNKRGISLIKRFEGVRLSAYPDPGTGGEPWTIGYGHTGGVCEGDTITQEQADEYLAADLACFEDAVSALVTVPLTSNQFSALVSFAYNCGAHNLKTSTLLLDLNAGDYAGAAERFGQWVKAAGKVLPGLVRRRKAEKELFLAPDDEAMA